MGFYGNITNTSNTTFQFDKVYPNRLSMDANVNNDGIFIGRYVLVEYDQSIAYPVVFINNGKFYSSPGYEDITRIKYGQNSDQIYLNDIVQNQEEDTIKYYKCTGNSNDGYALFTNIIELENRTNYITNYQIDENHYYNVSDFTEISFKGYDSTVWVKTTINTDDGLITKYVNIADMNSVVPTFAVVADAPTMNPITPHFDADSTNVYYKLHMQSPYGFRVAASEGKSDEQITWTTTTYDKETNTTTTSTTEPFAGDIYYNKAGFNPDVVSKVTDDNYIKLAPTAKSGAAYSHGQETNDIQEFRLHLPAIGNMMSDAWDIIHGPNRDDARTDENSSLQGRLDSFKFMADNQIPVKRAIDGTLVGTNINGNTNREIADIKTESLHISDKTKDDAWIRTEINTDALLDEDGNEVNNNGISIHHTFTATADTTSTSDKNEKHEADNGLNASVGDTLKLYTPIVDAAGHVVGKNTETVTLPYGYKTFTTEGLIATQDTDIWTTNFGNVEGSNYNSSASSNQTQTIANNTQDLMAIEPVNKWIQTKFENDKFSIAHEIHGFDRTSNGHTNLNEEDGAEQEDNITIYDWAFDNAGHITEKHKHTYTLPYGYKTIAVNNSNAVTAAPVSTDRKTQTADNTQDTIQFNASNKWIKLEAETEDTIKFGHILSPIAPNEAQELNKNSILHQSSDYNIASFGDSFNILNFTTDNAGHVIAVSEDTITIPEGRLDDTASTNASNVLTSIGFESSTGIITTTHENVGTLKLTGYNNNTTDKFKIQATDTINSAFATTQDYINSLNLNSSKADTNWVVDVKQVNGQTSIERAGTDSLKLNNYSAQGQGSTRVANADIINVAIAKLQNQIIAEEDARAAAINALDVTDTVDNTKYVSGVSETNGKITVSRGGTNTLQISNYNSDSTDSKKIFDGNTINGAFQKLEDRIIAEENNRKNAINTLYGNENGVNIAQTFDTIKEIADFLEQDANNGVQSGIETIINRIGSLETKVGDSSVNDQIDSKINSLDKTDAAVNGQYVSAVSETNGIITVTRADLPTYTLTSGTAEGTVGFNGNNVKVTGLKSAAFTDSTAYATAEQGNLAASAIQSTTEFIYQEEVTETNEETGEIIVIIPEEKVTIEDLIVKIKDLEAEIILLKGYHNSEA